MFRFILCENFTMREISKIKTQTEIHGIYNTATERGRRFKVAS